MQHQGAKSWEHIPNTAFNMEKEEGKQVTGFLYLLASLILDQTKMKQPACDNGQAEALRFGKTLKDELGDCIIHLIREAGTQEIDLPIVAAMPYAGRREAVTVREAESGYCWVDVYDTAAAKPMKYSIRVKSGEI
jgi:hypothetical protein